jgi:hypothetical protein
VSMFRRYFPILTWGAEYSRETFVNDLVVAGIVTIMLIPQSPTSVFYRGQNEHLKNRSEGLTAGSVYMEGSHYE